MNWADKRVLVIGGAGFISSNLVKKLLSIGSEVVVTDNLSGGKIQNLARAKTIRWYLSKKDVKKVENKLNKLLLERCFF